MRVELKGLEQLQRASEKLKGVAVFQLNSAAQSCAVLAQELAPVDTGFMRDHISQTEEASESSLRSATESEADYSEFVEYGTLDQEAQPFMTPAYESAKKQLLSIGRIF
jgi:HK97 gp10 family phage protein